MLAVAVCLLPIVATSQAPAPEQSEDASASFADDFRDAIDASAPQDAKSASRLRLAESLMHRGQFDRALEALLYTLDKADGGMVRLADGPLSPVADEANRLIGTLPKETLDLYRRQYGAAADKALQEALAAGRRAAIEQVAVQFRHTPAGRKASLQLAAIHFDRGEFGLALRVYESLFDGTLDAAGRLRMAYAAAASGNVKRAQEIAETLTDADLQGRVSGPASRADVDRLLARAAATGAPQPVLADWQLPFGNASSSALAESGEPILLRRWHQPLAFRMPLQSQIERMTLDLRDANRATVPTIMPLAIDDRVIARTLHGTSVYSISTGRLLWESQDQSLERRLALGPNYAYDPAMRQIMRMRGQFGIDPSQTMSPNEYGLLANTLFRNGVYGHVTADEQRLYVVEEDSEAVPASAARFAVNGMNMMSPDGSLGPSFNRLVAYDLETGRLAWPMFGGLGGDLTAAPFEPPLAGHFFFGPPTPDGNELYVVAEADKQIRLIALDPESGQSRWMRPIAEAPVGIAQDPVRQLWPAQVAVGNGVLVCPTTVGWLVAIEKASHSILWATRYAPPQAGGDASMVDPASSPAALNSRWAPAAPVIYRNRVYFTPAEEQRLVCLDLSTGTQVWQHGKGTSLALAGVVDGAIVIVGQHSVDALDAESGQARWSVPFPDRSVPSGRATITADRIYVPLGSDTLLAIDPRGGKIVSETPLPAGDASLGNLLLHRGTLLSLSPDGLTAFEERSKFVAAIESRLKENPSDIEALLRQAQLQYADGTIDAAAVTLDELSAQTLTPDQSKRVRSLRWDVLAAIVRSDGPTSDARLQSLQTLAETPDERFLVHRLAADRSLAAGLLEEAAKGYLSLIDGDESRTVSDENGRRTMSLDAWLSGRLYDVWTKSDGSAREAVDQLIAELLTTNASAATQSRLARICAFHPAATNLERALAKTDFVEGRIASGEMRLLRLAHGEPAGSASILQDLSNSVRGKGLDDDAEFWQKQAVLRNADEDTKENVEQGSAPRKTPLPADAWGEFDLSVLRTSGFSTSEPPQSLRFITAELPFFRNRSMKLVPDRLSISGPNGLGLEHLIPLQADSRTGSHTVAVAEGHVLFVLYRGMLQAVSPLEDRVLWSLPVPAESLARSFSERPVNPMRSANSLVSTAGSVYRARLNGAIAGANASYVALEKRREITVVDAATGKWRWTRSGWPQNAVVVGTDSLLYVLPSDGRPAKVLRAIDGEEIALPQAAGSVQHAVAAWGDRLLLLVQEPTLTLPLGLRVGGGATVSLYDPVTGKTDWKRTYPNETLFELADDGRLVVLTPDGTLSKIDTATGTPSKLGELPTELLRRQSSVVYLEDAGGSYAIVNVGRGDSSFAGIATLAVNGEVFAFDAADGRLRWRKEVSHRRLICEDFGQMPVLLFIDNEHTAGRPQNMQNVWRVNLLALHKRSGDAVLDESQFLNTTPVFRGFSVEPERRSIRLLGFNTQLRLVAVEKAAAPDPPAEKETSD